MLGSLTDFASSRRGKWVTLLVWVLLAGALISQLPRLDEVTENESALFLPEDAEATRGLRSGARALPLGGHAHADRRPRTNRPQRSDVGGGRRPRSVADGS